MSKIIISEERLNAIIANSINEALEDLEYPTAPWDETIASVIEVLRGDSD